MSTAPLPPPIIDSARVLEYATVSADMAYTERIHLIVGGERLGRVPNLAICRNYYVPEDVLLLFCDHDWNSQGCIAFTTVEEAKLKAERGYPAVADRWQVTPHDQAAIDHFLRNVYEVDPRSEWWRHICSFCQKDVEGMAVSKASATICLACVDSFHEAMHADA
jgi:hypothetical protein